LSPTQAGVIGFPLAHSISPQFQQPAFDALGLAVTYRAHEVAPEALPEFVEGLRQGDWLGVNVTIPHKRSIVELMDSLTDEAQQIGAVNTVIRHGPELLGHNTDASGFMRALEEHPAYTRQRLAMGAVLLGARGAARAVAVGLLRAGLRRLAIANRTVAQAESLCDELGTAFPQAAIGALPLQAEALRGPLAEAGLLVNSTSVGMAHGPAPDESPISSQLLGPHLLVYDLVYNPDRTPLLLEAASRGAETQPGLPMLVYQGAASFERWTGLAAPTEVMMAAARCALAARQAGMRHG
jgi:shikimate dehydrogenase